MSTVTVTRRVSLPRSTVFQALARFDNIHACHPAVERSPLNPGSAPTGLGAERTCHFYDGNSIQERIIEFEPDSRLVVDIYQGSMPLKTAVATFTLTDTPDGGTLLAMTMAYEPKYGLIGKAMDAMMMRRQFTGMMTLLLAGIEENTSNGTLIPKGWTPLAA